MDNKELYSYGVKDKTKLKGMEGFLIIIGSLNIMQFIISLASYCKVSQVELACVLSRDLILPELYFEVTRVGYSILTFFSIVMIIAFYKKFKIFKYLEIVNLVVKTAFLVILCFILGGISYMFHELTGLLLTSIVFSFGSIIYLFNSYRVKNTFVN